MREKGAQCAPLFAELLTAQGLSVADDLGGRVNGAFGFADQAFDGDQFLRAEGAELAVQAFDLLSGKAELPGQRRPHFGGDARVHFQAGDTLAHGGETGLQGRFGGAEGGSGGNVGNVGVGGGVHMVLWLQ